MINIQRAIDTPGWMHEPELLWLAEQAQTHEHIVELGVMLGRSVRALADHTPGLVVASDWFEGPPESTGTVTYHFAKPLDQLGEFSENLADHIATGKVVVKVGNHKDFEYLGTPDMVFIDGDHEYNSVKHDIEQWRARLAHGGLLCGHDIVIPDVLRAVSELLPDHAVATDTTIWYWNKP
jgi:predicted O-methyltransferase YrrM